MMKFLHIIRLNFTWLADIASARRDFQKAVPATTRRKRSKCEEACCDHAWTPRVMPTPGTCDADAEDDVDRPSDTRAQLANAIHDLSSTIFELMLHNCWQFTPEQVTVFSFIFSSDGPRINSCSGKCHLPS
mmetsp:Transcript_34363/g.80300  ORF Transcript_34363/g.80300 Transcript_34363/m.80300 type:complete len:131 (+) Transcript_34363:98-490(+)